MKRIIYISIFFSVSFNIATVRAQQYPLFTNYVINTFGYNPAVIGTQKNVEVRGLYRSQWLGVSGRPQTNLVSATGRLKKIPIALGAYFYKDGQGTMNNTGFNGMLAYNQKLDDNSSISVGFSGGYHKIGLQDVIFLQQDQDNVATSAQVGMWVPNLSAGVYFKQDNGLFAGVSVPQLYQKKLLFDPSLRRSNPTQIVRQYHGILGYNFKVSDMMSIEPSALIKVSPNVTPQYDASIRAIINKKFWVGGSFRTEDAVTAMAGLDMSRWMLAYSYDVTTSQLRNGSSGSHEIVFALRFGKDKCKDEDNDGICDKEDKCPKVPGTKENNGCPVEKEENCPDKDKDGICDKDDKCPDVFGTKELKGCPSNDRDNDGIRDDIDKCPDIPGTLKNEGCPLSDRDQDGILDEVDPCPDVYGTLANMGCPPETDRDKDGTPDKDDSCPDVPGPKDNKGCPKGGDRDNDGVPDDTDQCPNTAGPISNNGCPIISNDENEILTLAIQNLYFDTDKWKIRPAAYRNLNNLARLLKNKKDWKIIVEGHADITGNKAHNMMLSENRAMAVKNYLISKGVLPNQMIVQYYGDSRPTTPAKDKSGLEMNRRVELQFSFD